MKEVVTLLSSAMIEIVSRDGESVFRVDRNHKVRLILMPEDRPILIGHLSSDKSILTLFKSRSDFSAKSFTLCVPQELIDAIEGLRVIHVSTLDRELSLCCLVGDLKLYGVELKEDIKMNRQLYIYLENKYWDEVYSSGEVNSFEEDHAHNFNKKKRNDYEN